MNNSSASLISSHISNNQIQDQISQTEPPAMSHRDSIASRSFSNKNQEQIDIKPQNNILKTLYDQRNDDKVDTDSIDSNSDSGGEEVEDIKDDEQIELCNDNLVFSDLIYDIRFLELDFYKMINEVYK